MTPYVGETDPGIPFPLPQATGPFGRKVNGNSSALTIRSDGRLSMYIDRGSALWDENSEGTRDAGFVFATFDKTKIAPDPDSGRPVFSARPGEPLPRLAEILLDTPPGAISNEYPSDTGYAGGVAPIPGGLQATIPFASLDGESAIARAADHHGPWGERASS